MQRYRPVVHHPQDDTWDQITVGAHMEPWADGEWVRYADAAAGLADPEISIKALREMLGGVERERDTARASFTETENARCALLAEVRILRQERDDQRRLGNAALLEQRQRAERAEAERDTWRQHYDSLAATHAASGRHLERVTRERDAALADRPGRWVPVEEKLPGEGWRVEVARKGGRVCYPARFSEGVFRLHTPLGPGEVIPTGWVAFWRGSLAVDPEGGAGGVVDRQRDADRERLAIVQGELADQRRVYGEACAEIASLRSDRDRLHGLRDHLVKEQAALITELAPRDGETLLAAAKRRKRGNWTESVWTAVQQGTPTMEDHSCAERILAIIRERDFASAAAKDAGQRADAAEAELRTARAELVALRVPRHITETEEWQRGFKLGMKLGKQDGMEDAAASLEAGWCYDMRARPGPGRGVNVEAGETIILLAPNAWRRVVAPTRPEAAG